ncbi:MAG: hypothetical protein ABI700_30820, partial [Chloroflexota bacterium]
MWKRFLLLLLSLIAACLAACQPNASVSDATAEVVFPTMTAGRVIEAPLPDVLGIPLNGSGLSNPATAIALANRPTPTPNYRSCPDKNPSAALDATAPPNARLMDDAIARYLSDGGDTTTLETTLRDQWNVLAGGAVRGDVDLTGEGTPEVILTYSTPDEGGVLLIEGCIDGRYLTRYQAALGGATPQILTVADLNYNAIPDLLFASKDCTAACVYHTQMVTWNPEHGRFINLLGGAITSDQVPTAQDIDSDHVLELLNKFDNDGDKTTGP